MISSGTGISGDILPVSDIGSGISGAVTSIPIAVAMSCTVIEDIFLLATFQCLEHDQHEVRPLMPVNRPTNLACHETY